MGDVRQVTAAARSALKPMDIRLHSVDPYTDETVMNASTAELDITMKNRAGHQQHHPGHRGCQGIFTYKVPENTNPPPMTSYP